MLEPSVLGEVSSPLPFSAGPLFCKSSRGKNESVKPNRFSALQIQNLAPQGGGCPSRGLLGACLGYFVSGFMVLGFPLVFFCEILERKFQKCEAQPAFLPGDHLGAPGDFVVGLHASWFWGWASRFFFKSSRRSFKSVEPNRLSGPDVHFEHFGGLDPYTARMSFRSLIFSMLPACQILPRYCQNDARDAHFQHFVSLLLILPE